MSCEVEIGHIRWSRMDEILLKQRCGPPCKSARVDAASEPVSRGSVYVYPTSSQRTVDARDVSELAHIAQLLRDALQRAAAATNLSDVMYVHGDAENDVVRFSLSDFMSEGAAPHKCAYCIPSTLLIQCRADVSSTSIPIRVFRERYRCTTSSSSIESHQFWRDGVSHCISSSKILVVGAGGIGCELLKSIVLAGARNVTVVDLDTIDATNLNRQFLFRQHHVDLPKSDVAVKVIQERLQSDTASAFASTLPASSFQSMCVNVKDPYPMDHDFYRNFDVVLNGLDNMSARKHVNRMCVAANVPLIESGTMGFNGQVQPILPRKTECYDCRPRPSDQPTFAVCTIHARPTSMVHCVHYAKELYERLADSAISLRGCGDAIDHARGEMDFVTEFVLEALGGREAAVGSVPMDVSMRLYRLLFITKVEQLLALKQGTQWSTAPPVPLEELETTTQQNICIRDLNEKSIEKRLLVAGGGSPTTEENGALFVRSVSRLLERWQLMAASPIEVRFDKQDDLAVLFVTSAANLRASCFHIARQPLEELRSLAGSIVPAIASSNAIIAACIATQSLFLLSSSSNSLAARMSFVFLRKAPMLRRAHQDNGRGTTTTRVRHRLLLHTNALDKPNPQCLVCHSGNETVVHRIALNASKHTIGSFVHVILRGHYAMVSPCLALGAKVLFEDEEFENLAKRPLLEFLLAGQCPPAASFAASDLNQSLEWTLRVEHSSQFDDPAGYSVNGMMHGPLEARVNGQDQGDAPPTENDY